MSVAGISSSGTLSSGTGFSALSSEQFMKIVLTEMTRQDPMKPSDTNALLQQLATIRSIESDTQLTDRLGSLVGQNEFSSASAMMGKKISGISDKIERVEGTVTGVTRTQGGAVLTLDTGARVPFIWVDEVKAPPPDSGNDDNDNG
ncbi:MAG: flagellar hook capping FlgD N-terminal domain-containing protein [Planctomycetota bacterium]|nr:flagellar hook capping FlgD N-terminal domain-containing protein [Planctomycetota bacterium]